MSDKTDIYSPDQKALLERDAIVWGALSQIAQELGNIVRYDGSLGLHNFKHLQRLHGVACEALDKARKVKP